MATRAVVPRMRLTLNGLEVLSELPSAPFERAYLHGRANLAGQVLPAFEHFSSAWLDSRTLPLKIARAQLRTESPVSPRAETQIQRASIYGITL